MQEQGVHMRAREKFLLGAIVVAVSVLAAPLPAAATVIFFDDFSANPIGVPAASLVNWSIDRGTVDVVGTGSFASLCAGGPSPSRCVDLDGTGTSGAGKISHVEPSLGSGQYRISFYLQANDRGYAPDSVTVTFGPYSEVFTLPSLGNNLDSWLFFSRDVSYAGPPGLTLTFDHAGGDNVGILLDNVTIEAVPEPATLLLLGSGLTGLALRRRRRG